MAKFQVETKKHATLSASGSDRWLNCPGSIALSKKAPPSVDSKYSIEGTQAHTCFEVLMKSPRPRVAALMLKKQFPDEMVDHAYRLREWVHSKAPEGSEIMCETEVRLDFVKPGMFGTVDAAIAEIFGILWVIDLKYGKGRVVEPKENTQMIYYGLGIAHALHFNFDKVRLVVAQPRIVHKDGFNRHWDIEVPKLREYERIFKEGAKAAEAPNAPLKKGRWCFFCPAQGICPATEHEKYAEAQADFDDDF